MLAKVLEKNIPIVTVEENVLAGGFGSAIVESAIDMGYAPKVLRLGIPDEFVQHGSADELRGILKIDAEGIAEQIFAWLGKNTSLKLAC